MYYLAEKFTPQDEFIILFDDTHRKGEEDSVNAIATMLASKGIEVFVQSYEASKKIPSSLLRNISSLLHYNLFRNYTCL